MRKELKNHGLDLTEADWNNMAVNTASPIDVDDAMKEMIGKRVMGISPVVCLGYATDLMFYLEDENGNMSCISIGAFSASDYTDEAAAEIPKGLEYFLDTTEYTAPEKEKFVEAEE